MFKLVTVLLILALVSPVHAGMVGTPDPVEKSLTDAIKPRQELMQAPEKTDSERMTEEFQKDMRKAEQPVKTADSSSGSSWWKWALGIAVVGGVAAAAGGGGSSSGGSSGGGTVTTTW